MVVPGGSILLYPLTTPTWHLAWLHWVYASTYDSWWQYKMFTNIRLAGVVHAPACISATPSTPARNHHFMYTFTLHSDYDASSCNMPLYTTTLGFISGSKVKPFMVCLSPCEPQCPNLHTWVMLTHPLPLPQQPYTMKSPFGKCMPQLRVVKNACIRFWRSHGRLVQGYPNTIRILGGRGCGWASVVWSGAGAGKEHWCKYYRTLLHGA